MGHATRFGWFLKCGRCFRSMAATAVIVLLVLHLAEAQDTCNGQSKFDGFKGNLVTVEHQISGNVTITDACTAVVDNFRWDALPPATYFWCSQGNDPDSYRSGSRAQLMKVPPQTGPFRIEIKLAGMSRTWDDCPVFAVWCEDFAALLAYVVLKPPGTPVPIKPAPTPKPPAAENALMSWNCAELVPQKYHVYWKLSADQKNVSVALQLSYPTTEARVWMGFGFSDPSKTEAAMIGSDVTVAGFMDVTGTGFALDYYLTNKDQCDYETGQSAGVCPDSGLANTPSANNTMLTGVDVAMGIITVTFTHPVAASDKYDHMWPIDTGKPAVWAFGPLSEKSTAEQPVVLYHGATQRSDPSFKFSFTSTNSTCTNKVEPSTKIGGAPVAAGDPNAIKTIIGRTMFVIGIGSNANYPNPPAWGYSYRVNDLESPVLQVTRGVEYTFSVQAGDSHPFYITTDVSGGSSNKTEQIFSGSLQSQGTKEAPFILKWTPNATTPDTLFYQCAVHQKFGWKMQVVDPGNMSACSQTHPFVGFEGMIDGKEHGVKGTVKVLDDCTVKISGFFYDGAAPAVEVYLASADNTIKQGTNITSKLTRSYNGEDLMLRLPPGASWDKYSVLSVWCVQFSADFGHVKLMAAAPKAVSGCQLDFNGMQMFDSCTELTGLGKPFKLFLSAMPAGDNSILRGAIVSEAGGWAAWAIPKEAGKMPGASAVILRATANGVKVDGYTLADRTVAGVKMPATGFTLKTSSAGMNANGGKQQLVGTFEIEIAQPLSQLKSQPLNYIYANGAVSSSGDLQIHIEKAAGTIDLQSGKAMTQKASTNREALRVAHGYIMGLTWGVFIPLGIATASSFKDWGWWFTLHHFVNAGSYVIGLVGFGIGLYLGSDNGYVYKKHYSIGIAVIVMGGLQALSGWLRPRDKTSKLRRTWNVFHWWNGRVAALLAIINVFEGFRIIMAPSGLKLAYWFVLGAILFSAVSKQAFDHIQQPAPKDAKKVEPQHFDEAPMNSKLDDV